MKRRERNTEGNRRQVRETERERGRYKREGKRRE